MKALIRHLNQQKRGWLAVLIVTSVLIAVNPIQAVEGSGGPDIAPTKSAAAAAVKQLVTETKSKSQMKLCLNIATSPEDEIYTVKKVCFRSSSEYLAKNNYAPKKDYASQLKFQTLPIPTPEY